MNIATEQNPDIRDDYSSKSIFKSILHGLLFIVCFWVLAYFLLPNSLFGHLSPLAGIQWLTIDGASDTSVIAFVASCIGGWALYAMTVRLNEQTLALWFVIGCWWIATATSVIRLHNDAEIASAGEALLGSMTIGLITARVIGKPDQIGWLLVVLAGIQASYGLSFQHQHIHDVIVGSVARQRGTFEGLNAMSTIMAISLPLAVGNIIREKDSNWLFPSVLLTSVIIAALWVASSPVAILASGGGLVWMFWACTGRKFQCTLIAILILLAAGYLWHSGQPPQGTTLVAQRSLESLPHWKHGISVFARNWMTGLGVGALRDTVHSGLTINGTQSVLINLEPGDSLLQWLDEMGLGGGILFCLFVATICRCIGKKRDQVSVPFGAAWLTLLLLSTARTPFGTINTLYGNVIVGLLLGATLLSQTKEPVQKIIEPSEPVRSDVAIDSR